MAKDKGLRAVEDGPRGPKKMYKGRPIDKETIDVGTAGQIVKGDGMPELPPRAEVEVRVRMVVGSDKHKFLDNGHVELATVLTIQPSTFQVIEVHERAMDPALPGIEEEPAEGPEE